MDEMRRKGRERKEKTLYLVPAELCAADRREEEKNKKPSSVAWIINLCVRACVLVCMCETLFVWQCVRKR